MKLANWLKQNKIKRVDFARRIGVSPSYITWLCRNAAWPSRPVVLRIMSETGNAVQADDFLHCETAE